MKLVDQKSKGIMEECRVRATREGLTIQGDTLEYIVTNRDLLRLSPKIMIPTLYDYWPLEVEVVGNEWTYNARPSNPYETVINTRPAISFYNDNNADWLNVMIFYHVLFHIDFFQNNVFFKNTWNGDFCGEALADKRLIERTRNELGPERRWVDYVIEFARGIDNLVGYYPELEGESVIQAQSILGNFSGKFEFYFGEFLREHIDRGFIQIKFYYDEIDRFNVLKSNHGEKRGDEIFFNDSEFKAKFPEFNDVFEKNQRKKNPKTKDVFEYLLEHSEFMNRDKNRWMKDIIGVVRRTSLYFQPQIRTKIINEGWASLWHERLYISDPRIKSHEVDFADVNAGVIAMKRLSINPYVVGKCLLEFIEEMAEKGRFSREYQMLMSLEARKNFDRRPEEGAGRKALFEARTNLNDYMLVNLLSDRDFQDFVDRYKLFVVGQRFNPDKFTIEYYIKSKNGKDYRRMINDELYHPPNIEIRDEEGALYLNHVFEGRTLYTRYVPPVLKGIAFLFGGTVKLETTEFEINDTDSKILAIDSNYEPKYKKLRVVYTCKDQSMGREVISSDEEGS
ncbi:MAG: hypothetical protein A3C61_02875 [Candidatus Yanofskybacteria bacterium RIFCSPHIGHO2_02_FULL_39_10]|uniref:SpoVR protein-like N-terminal domain-containing protein n=1 Tax=Candidatus Yanofskybacteria bacterium RIFCSPHIGHO2_02_FULL_39_10 TaxID=1802674 RepID=A0A1F8F5Z5_9BACT|nr:MAG: hypothetical protein A3C61_02875 [Candidatus Yanofskybacteria bacterium RIFCSPHIGHO2_02_FULL_39_10]